MFYSTKTLETKSIKYYYIGICLKYFWMIFVVFFILLQLQEIQTHYYPRRYFKFIRESGRTYASMCKKENKEICVQTSLKRYFFSTKHVWHSYLKFFPFFLIQSETSVDTGNLASASASSKIQQQPLLRAVASMAATSSSTTTAR